MNIERRIKELDRKILLTSLIDAPGTVLLGLGIYAKVVGAGNAFLPVLNSQYFVNAILTVGAIIFIGGSLRIVALNHEKSRVNDARIF